MRFLCFAINSKALAKASKIRKTEPKIDRNQNVLAIYNWTVLLVHSGELDKAKKVRSNKKKDITFLVYILIYSGF